MHEMVAVVSVFALVPLGAMVALYLIRRLQTRERLAAIEKGVPIPFAPADAAERLARVRRWGIVLVALGLGTAVFLALGCWIMSDRDLLFPAASAAIPIMVGLGLLYDHRLRKKELAEERDTLPTPARS